eukprot:gnl/TRDRNA2_/TRDRNA2_165028_c0_seq2.p1 gnl/TRDRNA2_/TRDRNA2_165028_c0~~gnl/TRDRNA2_/TRDRNA2_165028_c0_seq2.p1  ORF type:complete len:710 (-),score=118.61 gnl/TRDRNA2_/TRDRNA2_165028_c0_seq2:61-2190(-)
MIRAGAARRSASGLLAPTASTTRMPWEEKDVEGTEMLDQQWKAIEEELQKAEKRAQIWNQRMEHLPTFISDVTHEAVDHMKKDVQDLSQHGVSKRNSFQVLVLTAIFANTLTMGLEVDMPEQADFFYVCEIVFLVIFLLEMAFKLRDERLRYFTSIWNLFDFFLVMMSLVNTCILQPVVGSVTIARKSSMLRILRLVRIVRMVRLLKTFKELVIIIKGITSSVRTIGWVTLLLVILLYVVAIICTTVIGQEEDMYDYQEEVQIKFNNYQYFGNIPRSMYTLINIVILAEWPEIGRAVIEKQAYIFPVFLLFIAFTTFGLANVVIAVIVEGMTNATEEMAKSRQDHEAVLNLMKLKGVHDVIYELDRKNAHVITRETFMTAWNDNPEVPMALFAALDLPKYAGAEEVFDLLDSSGDGRLSAPEFMLGTFRLNEHSEFDAASMCLISQHRTERRIRSVEAVVEKELSALSGRVEMLPQKIERLLSVNASSNGVVRECGLPPVFPGAPVHNDTMLPSISGVVRPPASKEEVCAAVRDLTRPELPRKPKTEPARIEVEECSTPRLLKESSTDPSLPPAPIDVKDNGRAQSEKIDEQLYTIYSMIDKIMFQRMEGLDLAIRQAFDERMRFHQDVTGDLPPAPREIGDVMRQVVGGPLNYIMARVDDLSGRRTPSSPGGHELVVFSETTRAPYITPASTPAASREATRVENVIAL